VKNRCAAHVVVDAARSQPTWCSTPSQLAWCSMPSHPTWCSMPSQPTWCTCPRSPRGAARHRRWCWWHCAVLFLIGWWRRTTVGHQTPTHVAACMPSGSALSAKSAPAGMCFWGGWVGW
jgi:hypothetical protein